MELEREFGRMFRKIIRITINTIHLIPSTSFKIIVNSVKLAPR